MKRLNSQGQTGCILFFIILTGTLLRFWNFQDIPFTFDELSAMSRTQFDSFRDLIRVGVVEKDSHPAGIQVFLYYWVMLIGEGEMVIKLPFLLAGVASIYLAYRIGDIWFGKTAGILTAAYLSSLQLFVMYSQMARPYVSGLFFTLFAVLFWSKYFFRSPKIKFLAGFIVFSVLAAYNHYFSLLFIAVLGISGLFLVQRKNLLAYIISGFVILILYIPHLSIIFTQAEKGTIGGWLGEPGPYFLLEFSYWLFHQSFIPIMAFIMILATGFFMKKASLKMTLLSKKRWLLLLWLLPAPVFGYIYSYAKEPILQYSLLIFTAPYIFLLLFSFVGEWKMKALVIAVIMICAVNISTLVAGKQYYQHFYQQPFNQMVKNAVALEADNRAEVFIINNYIPYYTEYYFRKYDQELPFYTTRNKNVSISDFKKMLSEINQDEVITSGLDDIYFQLILEQFPYWAGFEKGFTYEQYVFSRNNLNIHTAPVREIITETTFDSNDNDWQYNNDHLVADTSSGNHYYLIMAEETYGPKIEVLLSELMDDIYQIVDIEVEIVSADADLNAVIVGEIKKGEELIHWQGSDFSEFGIETGKHQKIFLTMDIQKAMSNKNKIDDKILRFYIWNRGKQQFAIHYIKLFMRPGNTARYKL
jgi:hypothetical protein